MAVLAAVVALGAALQGATAIPHLQVPRRGQTEPPRLREARLAQDEAVAVAAQVLQGQPETHRATAAQVQRRQFLDRL